MSKSIHEIEYWDQTRHDFGFFLKHAYLANNPGKAFLDNWHLDAIELALDEAQRGHNSRLIINLPPRMLKSFMIGAAWPAFLLGHDPLAKIVNVSHSESLCIAHTREFRRIVDAPWYRGLFPNVRLVKSTETEVVTSLGGGRLAIPVHGAITGRGADILIVDDCLNAADSLSDKSRTRVNDTFDTALYTRLDDKRRGVLVIVMQRLHEMDLTGHLENTGGFKKLAFAAIATEDETIRVGHGVDDYYHRKAGEALHPEWEDAETLQQTRDMLPAAIWSAQYQQKPNAPDGKLFEAKFLPVIPRKPRHQRDRERYWISIDAAASTSDSADFSALTVGGSTPEGAIHYILRCERGRWAYPQLLKKTLAYYRAFEDWKPMLIIERASNGIPLVDTLREMGLNPQVHEAKHSKMYRALKALPAFAEGRVRIVGDPSKDTWIPTLRSEFLSFPEGRFDDMVDSVVQAVRVHESIVKPTGKVWIAYSDRELNKYK